MTALPRVLFINHDASRTGAPLVLLHFLRWFVREVGWPFRIVLLYGGELRKEFEALAPTACLADGVWGTLSPPRSALRRAGFDSVGRAVQKAMFTRHVGPTPDLTYCNSMGAAPSLAVLPEIRSSLLTHVHELDYCFSVTGYAEDVTRLLNATTRFIACSAAVRDYLMGARGISGDAVDVVHGFLLPDQGSRQAERHQLRARLGIPNGATVIGAVGTIGWRKGTDLFLQLARLMRHSSRPLHFLWVGAGDREEVGRARHDVRVADLAGEVTFAGPFDDPQPLYELMDVFVLTSREDPFPLVCLEAAAAGKPIVCFDGAGGTSELVESDAGFVVPYLDLGAMRDRVRDLVEDDALRVRMGEAGRRKVYERHTLEATAPKIMRVMEGLLRENRAAR